jgi:hypothetical protein
MRITTTITLIVNSLLLHAQSGIPEWGHENFKKFTDKYHLANYIKPQFLEADFSGDKTSDLALLIERKSDKKKGILILFAQTGQSFILGAGNEFGTGGDNFNWAGRWEVFNEKITYETTFKENGDVDGGKEVKLKRPAIEIREEEGSGGLIYFDGKKFTWIHQGD